MIALYLLAMRVRSEECWLHPERSLSRIRIAARAARLQRARVVAAGAAGGLHIFSLASRYRGAHDRAVPYCTAWYSDA